MHRLRHVGGLLALTLAALAVAGHAFAAESTTVPVSRFGEWTTTPAGQFDHAPIVALGASLVVPAGQTSYLTAKLVLGAAHEVTAVGARIDCRTGPWSADPASVAFGIVSGQNILDDGKEITLLTRGLVSAPSSSDYTCSLDAQLVNHESVNDPGTISVRKVSFLQDVSGRLPWHAQAWLPSRLLVDRAAGVARTQRFTVPKGRSSFSALADVNVTTCYGSDTRAPCSTARQSFDRAYVGTQLLAQQYNANGTPCGPIWANGPLTSRVVTARVHHFKINQSGVVPVRRDCTSRSFVVWSRVTASLSGNAVVVEANHQTVTAAWVVA